MIAEQKQAAKDHRLELTDEQTFYEVVADACQRMLLDTNAGQRLAEFGVQSKQNQSIVQDVIQWIRDILEKLRNIFADVDPDSLAAQEFAKFDASVKQILADMYVDMTIDAGENLAVIKKAFGSNTQVSKKENKLDATEGKYRLKQLQEQGASFMLPKSENKKITMSMTDSERTEVLKDKVITAEVYDGQSDNSIIREKDSLESRQLGMIKSALRRIAEEFDVYVDY